MAKIMTKFFITCLTLNSIWLLLPSFAACSSSSSTSTSLNAAVLCKELNQWNCYFAKNSGNFCSSKYEGKTEIRWYYDKGQCRKFAYKGCNGNRNRFCTKDSCMKRCQED